MPDDVKRMPRAETMSSSDALRVGEELRDARLSLGVTVEQMADHLRINRRYIAALEEGRSKDLPGPAYALGFVRSYARALGLDADELTRRFRDGAGTAGRGRTDLVFPEPVPKRGVPAGAVILLGALLAAGSYAAWWNWSGSGQRIVDRVEEPPARIEEAARNAAPESAPVLPPTMGQAVPVGPGASRPSVPAGSASAPSPVPPPAASPAPAAGNGPATGPGPVIAQAPRPGVQPGPSTAAPATPGGSRPATPPGGGVVPGATAPAATPPSAPAGPAPGGPGSAPPSATAAAPPAPPPPATPTAPVQAEGQGRIVLRATDESWVQLRDPRNGRTLLNRVLRPNETFAVPAVEGLMLTTGKAQALEVLVDGQPSGALAGRSNVVRDIPLDPERLKAAGQGGGATRP
ncbi:DUF4115 domain-containing protein [Roseomonas sp. OT10]|uniref:helix-turn-helix domain-containing protein n=1 Tax=Roseomonas cutis TaxID=2897332 RepID=UPI001E5A31D0|nr:helix-turn-helix domain-containing protein [Roseomonas sp. OT10]UFN50117.1 DUF4115 domain-containing protein [Roseomonas sp. OT10]